MLERTQTLSGRSPSNSESFKSRAKTCPYSPRSFSFSPSLLLCSSALCTSYPDDNCAAAFPNSGFGAPKDPQTVFPNYLNHTSGIDIISIYLNSTGFAQANGKPFLMMETNTASCGGFPGVSDSFGAALWALDYGMQMAYSNFSGALLHVGGVSDTYNVSARVRYICDVGIVVDE